MKKFTFGVVLSMIFVLTGTVNAQISTFPYAESFEAGAGGWASDAGSNDSWALGAPANAIINSASDGTEAWVTNLTGNYNGSSSASIVSPVFDFSALGADPTLKMDVWWNSEFSWDGAKVQTSVDGGANWTRLGAAGDPLNWYNDTTVLGDHAWTGEFGSSSGGWVEAEHALDGLAGQSAVTLRVWFGSDSSAQREGFAFDNVRITTIVGAEPVIACPADQMINTVGGICTGVANWSTPIALDPEDGPLPVMQVAGPMSGDALAPGAYVVTYEATDADGNTVDCSFNVTVADMEAPIVVCQDISLDLDAAGSITVTPADLDGGSTDNCGIVSSTMTTGVNASGTLDVGFAANNAAAGNMFEIMALNPITINSFDISVNDLTVGALHNYEVYFKVGSWEGSQTTPGDWTLVASPTGIINVGPGLATPLNLSLGIDVAAGELVAFYVTATDGSSLAYTGSTGTTGVGNLWASDANIEFYEGAGKGYPFGATFAPRVWNGNIQYETGEIPFSGTFDCSNIGANVINVTHTDAAGNSSTCMATVTISDVTAPVLACIGEPANITDSTSGTPNLPIISNAGPVLSTLTVTDDFLITDLDLDLDIAHTWVGDLVVTLTAPTGETAILIDRMGVPIIGAAGCSSDDLLITLDDEAASPIEDECQPGPPAATGSFSPNNPLSVFDGVSTVGDWILSVDDAVGGDDGNLNAWGLSYGHDVSGSALEVILDANGMATLNASDLLLSVDEACGWSASVGGNPAPVVITHSTTQTIVPGDGITCNGGGIANDNSFFRAFDLAGDFGIAGDFEVTDAEFGVETITGPFLMTVNVYSWNTFPTGAGTLQGSGTITIDVADAGTVVSVPVAATIPGGDIMVYELLITGDGTTSFFVGANQEGQTGASWILAPDCGAVDITDIADFGFANSYVMNINGIPSGGPATTLDLDCSMLGDNLIEVTVTDDSGNTATCMATVTVKDETAPILVCIDVTLELGPDGTTTVDPLALLGSTDSTYTVLVIGSDNDSGTEGFTDITVAVTADETVSFDWDYVLNDVPGFDSFGYLLNGTYTALIDPAVGDQNGSETIGLTAGDVFGFRSQTDDNVFGNNETVISNFLPGFTGQFAPANWTETLTNSDGSATFIEIPGGPLSFDACGITDYGVSITEVTCADIGTPVTITVFASDSSGNSAVCTSTVTVVDLLAPVITCPADQTVDPGPGNLFYTIPDYIGTGEALAEDNCTDPVTITTQDPAAGSLVSDGSYTVTITGEDESGNIGTCSFELTVESVLGFEDNELDNAISMYPNPAQDRVTISNTSNVQLETAVIYDMNGKMINQIDLSKMQGEQMIDISDLASGVYVVQLTSDTSSAVKRLIKE
jgi:subtilisin-like proprotein convertase family protein